MISPYECRDVDATAGIGDAARTGGFPATASGCRLLATTLSLYGTPFFACGFRLQIFFLCDDWDDGHSARRAALIWESGYSPLLPPSERLAGRGVRKNGAQNLDVKELRGQNLENK